MKTNQTNAEATVAQPATKTIILKRHCHERNKTKRDSFIENVYNLKLDYEDLCSVLNLKYMFDDTKVKNRSFTVVLMAEVPFEYANEVKKYEIKSRKDSFVTAPKAQVIPIKIGLSVCSTEDVFKTETGLHKAINAIEIYPKVLKVKTVPTKRNLQKFLFDYSTKIETKCSANAELAKIKKLYK